MGEAGQFDQIRVAVRTIADAIEMTAKAGATREELVRMATAVRDGRAELKLVQENLERRIAAHGRGRFVVPGEGEVFVHKNTKRNAWQKVDLAHEVARRLSDDRGLVVDDGGALRPIGELLVAFTDRFMECMSVTGGKVTGLRVLGIDADEYANVETDDDAPLSVQLPAGSA